MDIAILVLAFVALAGGAHLLVVRSDKARIAAVAREAGWRDVRIARAPFAAVRTARKGERYYRVRYRDGEGEERERLCVSARSGVRWRE